MARLSVPVACYKGSVACYKRGRVGRKFTTFCLGHHSPSHAQIISPFEVFVNGVNT